MANAPGQSPEEAARIREESLARYEDLRRRATAIKKEVDRRKRPQPLRIVAIVVIALGLTAGLYYFTRSPTLTALGVFAGVPLLALLGAFVGTLVQHGSSERDRAAQASFGEAELLHDPEARTVELRTELAGDALALFVACYFDFTVVRWGAREWSPEDHGGRLVPRARDVARAAKEQLDRGVAPAELALDAGPYAAGTAAIPRPKGHLDLRCELARIRRGPGLTAVEPMVGFDKGEVCASAFPAVLAFVLRSERADAKALCALVLDQCDALAALGKAPARWEATKRALKKHPRFAATLAAAPKAAS